MAGVEGRVALVTGAGSADGIGFATAQLLRDKGAKVAITSTTDRIFERLEQLGGGSDLVVGFRLQLSSLECKLDNDDDVFEILRSRIRELRATGCAGNDLLVNIANSIGNLVVSGFERFF